MPRGARLPLETWRCEWLHYRPLPHHFVRVTASTPPLPHSQACTPDMVRAYDKARAKVEAEYEADKEITETGDFLEDELVFIGGDVCALYPSSTARLAGEAEKGVN